jgi:hypothetical protein
MTQEGFETAKNVADAAAGATAVGILLGYLTPAAAGLTVLWYLIRLYEWAERRFFGKPGGPTTRE